MTTEFLIRVRVDQLGQATADVVQDAHPGTLPRSIPGPACPEHVRELVRVQAGRSGRRPFPASWRCPTPGCQHVLWDRK